MRQPAEPQAHDILTAAQVGQRLRQQLRHLGLGVAEARQHQNAPRPRRPRKVTEQQERGRIGPMNVFQHHQHRPPLTHACEQIRHRGVQTVAFGVRIRLDRRGELIDPHGQLGQQPRQLAGSGAQHSLQLTRLDRSNPLLERGHERPVGRRHNRIAFTVKDECAISGGRGRKLPHQAALARPRLAAEQHHPATLALLSRQQRAQHFELDRAANEGKRRRDAERGRKIVHGAAPEAR
jgi:hypothetical protein